MLVLGIDPSSNAVGYALLCGLEQNDIVEAGIIKPSLRNSQVKHQCPEVDDWIKCDELKAFRRIIALVHDLENLMSGHKPTKVVIEIPSGKIGTGAKLGARGALTTYGFAAGVLYSAASYHHRQHGWPIPVTERQWTAGSGNKKKRQQALALFYGGRYDPQQDKGGDASDAIGIARWWLLKQSKRGVYNGTEICDNQRMDERARSHRVSRAGRQADTGASP